MSIVLTPDQIQNLKTSGKILSTALNEVVAALKPGISSHTLDKIAESSIRRQGGKPSFLNYGDRENPFPSSLCVSINHEVVHGLPKSDKIVRSGDIVSLDLGAGYKGVYTDMAKSLIVGKADPEYHRLLKVTEEALYIGISQATAGAWTGDIGSKIQKFVESQGYGVVKALVGHGIGLAPHQAPQVPNFGKEGTGDQLQENSAIAIEPMVNIGSGDVRSSSDGWTVKTYDGKCSAHFEHTILITKGKPLVVTA